MKYYFTEKFIVRQPLLPIHNNLSAKKEKSILKNTPLFEEAIYLSSPEFYKEMIRFLESSDSNDERIIKSLNKYINRMTNRSTPFGLFGNCGIGKWGIKNQSKGSTNLTRKTRLDMLYLCELYSFLMTQPSVQNEVMFFPNSSLYVLGEMLRYIEYTIIDDNRSYHITEVNCTEELELLLNFSNKGARYNDLIQCLASMGHSQEDSIEFLNDCIQSQLLVSEIEPTVTGEDNLEKILNILSKINDPNIIYIYNILKGIKLGLQNLDYGQNSSEDYKSIIYQLKQIKKVSINEKYLFQVDSFRNDLELSLDKKIQSELIEAIEVLSILVGSENTGNSNLIRFKHAFNARYEESFVALSEVLDAESGIGYPKGTKNGYSDLTNGINMTRENKTGVIKKISINHHTKFLNNLLEQSQNNSLKSIGISKKQLFENGFENKKEKLPLSMSAMVTLLKGEKLHLEGLSGPSAINVLSRFGHGSNEIKSLIEEIVNKEDSLTNDILLAEILHLPEGRIGNIILHPKYRKYEIPYLAGSVNHEFSIPISDLEVGIKRNMIVLRSKSLNKIILPRLSNAHSYRLNALPLYHFLCDIQTQFTKRSLFFEWPDLGSEKTFYPRLEVGNVIISPAMWRIKLDRLSELAKGKLPFHEFADNGIPSKVVYSEGDNTLMIDLEKLDFLKILVDACKNSDSVILKEYLDITEQFQNTDGNFAHQLIIPVCNTEPNMDLIAMQSIELDKERNKQVKKTFIPGSEWVYFKIYCGKQACERIISTELNNLIKIIKEKGLIESWFFVRYEDPEHHLRLRFRLAQAENFGKLIQFLNNYIQDWINKKLVYKILLDTYIREVERYLSEKISSVEYLFYADSEATNSYLTSLSGNIERSRWLFALKSIDELLKDFGLNDDEKIAFLEEPITYFKKEFGADKSLLQKINKKFKLHCSEINQFFEEDLASSIILKERSEKSADSIKEIKKFYINNIVKKNLPALIADLTHMLANRLFPFDQRFQEYIVYEILSIYYKFIKHAGSKKSLEKRID